MGQIVDIIKGTDGRVRGARVRVLSKRGKPTILQRPIQRLYPLEIRDCIDGDNRGEEPDDHRDLTPNQELTVNTDARPHRSAAVQARDKNSTLN